MASSALADLSGTFQLKETGTSPGLGGFKLWNKYFQSGVSGVLAGHYNFAIQPGSSVTAPGITDSSGLPTTGFCIEMQYSTTSSYKWYDLVALSDAPVSAYPNNDSLPMGAAKATDLAKLWAAHYNDTIGSNTDAAAFQLAVWEIVYENASSWNVTSTSDVTNGFKATGNSAALNLANTWLGELANGDYVAVAPNLAAYSNATYQDYMVQVPAPGAILLGMMGLGLVGWIRKRKHA
jgi:hypothetical protein